MLRRMLIIQSNNRAAFVVEGRSSQTDVCFLNLRSRPSWWWCHWEYDLSCNGATTKVAKYHLPENTHQEKLAYRSSTEFTIKKASAKVFICRRHLAIEPSAELVSVIKQSSRLNREKKTCTAQHATRPSLGL
jgi:hypothetical protein